MFSICSTRTACWVSFFFLSEPGCAATHDLTLADEFGVEFGSVEGEEDVEVYT